MFPGRLAALERLVTHSQALIYPPGTKPEKYYGGSPLFRAKLISCSWVILSLSAGGGMKGKWISRLAQVNKELLGWSDLSIWAGFLVIFAYAMGTLHEHSEERMRELRETYFGVLQILSQMISNDKFTQNHSYRVSIYATQIALELGMGDDQVEDVRAAALLHDVGKLEISREVLYKAARLTDDEMKEIKTHVERGVGLLSPVGGSLRRVLPIILAHHDKFDGSGYHPTKGPQIPIEAMVISVADVFDSLVSDRPYRKGLSPFEARDTIVKASGTDFDPRIVNAFEAAFRKQRLEVPEVLV